MSSVEVFQPPEDAAPAAAPVGVGSEAAAPILPSAGAARRRLSGRVALTPMASNALVNNDRAEKNDRRQREARRRSGRFTPMAAVIGRGPNGHGHNQQVTQQGLAAANEDLAAQVSETIKLHVANKINEKNAFALPLGGMLRSTNTKFERASVILEAGTMIYGKRVDCTLVDSLKVRENLLRTKAAEADQPKGSVIKTNVSKKVCAAATLERNLANITESQHNQAFSVDPLFRQMSQKFDKGGAQGMLLNSLPVKQGCFVAFDSGQRLFSEEEEESAAEKPGTSSAAKASKKTAADTGSVIIPFAALTTFHDIMQRVDKLPMCSALLDVLYNEAAAEQPFKQNGNAPTVPSITAADQPVRRMWSG
jgi:hypothetical protein